MPLGFIPQEKSSVDNFLIGFLMVRLSVIILGYNNPDKWWRRCVESVCLACGSEDEIICVDDGSTRKPECLHELALKDSRIRVVSCPVNGGPSYARNAGLDCAEGRFVSFVDGDDELCGASLQRCVGRLVETKDDICFYGVKTIWTTDGLCKTDVPEDRDWGRLQPADVKAISDLTLFNYVWNKVYSRDFLMANGIRFEPKREVKSGERPLVFGGEDCVFNLRCIIAGAKWSSVPVCGYIYYRPRTTLLSSYQPWGRLGAQMVSDAWREYKDLIPGAREELIDFGEMSDSALDRMEWRNIWMPGTPFSLRGRWKWLKAHPELGGAKAFFKMMLWTFVRRHFYFRLVRRWHTKRLFPNATEWNG